MRQMRWPTRRRALWPASAAAVLAVALVILGSLDKTRRPDSKAAAAAVRPLALVETAAAANRERVPCSRFRPSWQPSERRSGGADPVAADARPSAASATTSIASPTDARRGAGDEEQDLPSRRHRRLEDDRRHRRLARADVDAHDPEHGPAGPMGRHPVRQGGLHSAYVDRLPARLWSLVSLGENARLRAAPRRQPDHRQLGGHVVPAPRDQDRPRAELVDEALLGERDGDERSARSAPRAGGLPARRALDHEDLLERADEDAARDQRRHHLRREEETASASSTRRGGSAHGRERRAAGSCVRWSSTRPSPTSIAGTSRRRTPGSSRSRSGPRFARSSSADRD